MMKEKKKDRRAGYSFRLVLLVFFAIASGLMVVGQNIRWESNNAVIRVGSNIEKIYRVWCSENLEDWHLVGIVAGTGAPIEWMDSQTDGIAKKFYNFEQIANGVASEMDSDGDGFDDVYELNHIASGMDPMVSANAPAVSSVTVAETAIAAGALRSALHQTTITIQLSAAVACPVQVWLQGGLGVDTPSTVQLDGFATATWNDQVFEAGGEHPSQASIEVMTDANGVAVLTLTSSNRIGESCVAHARAGTIRSDVSQAQSAPVQFEQGEIQIHLPGPLIANQVVTATVTCTYNDQPLVGHEIHTLVDQVIVNGIKRASDPNNPDALSSYVGILESEQLPQYTDANGQVTCDIQINAVEGLSSMQVRATDLQQVLGE